MYSKFWPKGGLPGILHHYTESLVAFEFTTNTVRKPHSLVFIGGLGDGLGTTSYMADLVRALQPTEWSLFSLNISSSYQSWGLGHLDRDTDEIAQCVRYVKDYKAGKYGNAGKLVLMGHSTGSQHVLHYLSAPNPHTSAPAFDAELEHVERPALDGAVMQAPVSDREAMQWVLHHGWLGKTPSQTRETFDALVAMAKDATRKSDQSCDFLLPLAMTSAIGYRGAPLSARRFLSLVSPESPAAPREDDMFSSDLGDGHLRTTFGMVRERRLLRYRLMVMVSGADQSTPDWVNMEKLMARWRDAADHGGEAQVWDRDFSGIIPNASHALSNDDQAECRRDLCERVLGYLHASEQGPVVLRSYCPAHGEAWASSSEFAVVVDILHDHVQRLLDVLPPVVRLEVRKNLDHSEVHAYGSFAGISKDVDTAAKYVAVIATYERGQVGRDTITGYG